MKFSVSHGLMGGAVGGLDRYEGMLKEDRETKAEQTKLDIAQQREQSMLLWKNDQAAKAGEAQKDRDFARSQSPEVLEAEEQAQERARQSGVADATAMAEGAQKQEGSAGAVAHREAMGKEKLAAQEKQLRAGQALKDEFAVKAKTKADKEFNDALAKHGDSLTESQLLKLQMKRAGIEIPKDDTKVKKLTQNEFLTQRDKLRTSLTEGMNTTDPGVVQSINKQLEAFDAQYAPKETREMTIGQKKELETKKLEADKMVSTVDDINKLAASINAGSAKDEAFVRLLPREKQQKIKDAADALGGTKAPMAPPRLKAGQTKQKVDSDVFSIPTIGSSTAGREQAATRAEQKRKNIVQQREQLSY